MRHHPTLLPTLLLMLSLPQAARASYTCALGSDATLGLWSVWEVAQNEYLLTASLSPDTGSPEAIRLYNLDFTWDAERLLPVGPPTAGTLFEGQPEQWFGHFDSGPTRTVTATLLGDVPGVTPAGPVTLFSQLFHAVGPGGPAAIDLVSLTLRGPDNDAIAVTATDAVLLQVDVTPPLGYLFDVSAIQPAGNQSWTAQQLVASSLASGDGSLAGLILNETAGLPANTDAAWLPPPAPASYLLSPGDGLKTVRAWLRDGYGNRTAMSDSIALDTAAPGHVTQLTARPRHEGVQLDWLNPSVDFDRVRLYRRGWSDDGASRYPEYDDIDAMSPYPESEAQALAAGFTPVYEGAGQSWLDAVAPRDVYRYAAFCLDPAGNVGPGHVEARDRSTNYLLGDTWTPWDGTVFVLDLVRLAGSYSTALGDAAYNPQLDFGPTDDHSREGIPLTDNLVGFEDLMIFAMNYGQSGPVLDLRPLADKGAAATASRGELTIIVTPSGLELGLADATDWLGLHLLLTWEGTATPELACAGDAVITQVGPGRLLLDRVLLPGEDPAAPLAELSFAGGLPANLCVAELTLRDGANQPLPVAGTVAPGARPRGLDFHGLQPNPFNPETSLHFWLPEAADARVLVYNALGQLVRSVEAGRLEAGERTLRLSGDGLASGLYLIELRAGVERRIQRALLLR